MRKFSGQNLFLVGVVVFCCLVVGYVAFDNPGMAKDPPTASRLSLKDIPFNGTRAYEYLKEICAIGPRPSGSEGMRVQQKMLADYFTKLGGKVSFQSFDVRHPVDGSRVSMSNLIVQWHPDRRDRILLCAHYDTRPYPDRDPQSPRGTFLGANDGASGVALLMELAEGLAQMNSRRGVDFVLFDGEEFVFNDRDEYFLGSNEFARDYAANPPKYRYRWGVLLDMVGDADLQIYQERNSAWWSDTRPLVNDIWETARKLGVREFIAQKKYELRDDHLKLHNVAKIPTCDVIDFDYPYWHTEGDSPEKCSALSLAKVGWVIQQWLIAAANKK